MPRPRPVPRDYRGCFEDAQDRERELKTIADVRDKVAGIYRKLEPMLATERGKALYAAILLRDDAARAAIAAFAGAELVDEPAKQAYPTPLDFSRKVKCGVGRIRIDTARMQATTR